MTTDTKLADLPANVGAAAQARRLYQHVCNGGAVTPRDISHMVATIEKLEAALAQQEAVAFCKDGVLFWHGDYAAHRGDNFDLYAAPPAAQAVDLEQFRAVVERDLGNARALCQITRINECERLLALIDQQADHFHDATKMVAAQGVDLSIFRDAVEYAHDYGSERKRPERARLLDLIDQQAGKENIHG